MTEEKALPGIMVILFITVAFLVSKNDIERREQEAAQHTIIKLTEKIDSLEIQNMILKNDLDLVRLRTYNKEDQ